MTERRNQRRSPAAREGKLYCVYDETGVDIRGRFIIDPDFAIRAMEVFTPEAGRNPEEPLRQIKRNAPVTLRLRSAGQPPRVVPESYGASALVKIAE